MTMLRRRIRSVGLVAMLGLLGLGLWWAIPTEEQRIRRVLEEARAAVSADGGTGSTTPPDGPGGTLAMLGRVGRLTRCLTRDVEVEVDVFGGLSGHLNGVEEVRAAAAGLVQHLPGLKVRFSEVEIRQIDPPGARATLVATIDTGAREGRAAQEFELRFRKWEGRWYISRVATVRALRSR